MMMTRYMTVSLVAFSLLAFSGCMVSKDRYTEAVQEADAAKADLERVEARKAALEQQVKTLKELNAKLSQEAQLVKDELQRIEHGRDTERVSLDQRNTQLERQLRALAAQHRQLRKQFQDLKRRNKALQSTVARYQKELKQRGTPESPVGTAATPAPNNRKPASTSKPASATKVAKAPAKPAAAPPGANGRTVVNLNTASASDMMLLLNLSKEDANRVITNRPYRIKGELVAKNVIPKPTFDRIKDRVTVKQ